MGWGWKVAVHPDDLPKMLEVFRNALDSGWPFDVEGRLRRADGEYRRFLFRGDPVLDESGKVVKWYGTNIDLEDRARADDALRQSEQILRTAVDSIPGLVAIMTAEGGVEWVNRKVLEYFGKTLDEFLHWGTSSLVHPNDLPRVVAAWMHSIESRDTVRGRAPPASRGRRVPVVCIARSPASGWQRTHSPLAQLID